jgi:hypothetical protein
MLIAAAALCTACVHQETPWDPIGTEGYDSGNWFGPRFSLQVPDDWMKLNDVEDGLVATRDGFNLQAIKVRRIDPGKPLPHTKKMLARGMRPAELAEVLLDDLRSDAGAKGLKVLETRPATVAGAPGFRTSVAFKDGYGLKMRAVLCGVLLGDHAWQLAYVAPARYYYDHDLAVFDQALASFKVR